MRTQENVPIESGDSYFKEFTFIDNLNYYYREKRFDCLFVMNKIKNYFTHFKNSFTYRKLRYQL